MNNNIDCQGARAPSIQFLPTNLCVSRVKLMIFVLNVANSGPHLTFFERNTITRGGFSTRYSARGPALRWKDFFWSSPFIQAKFAKISEVPVAPCNVNPS